MFLAENHLFLKWTADFDMNRVKNLIEWGKRSRWRQNSTSGVEDEEDRAVVQLNWWKYSQDCSAEQNIDCILEYHKVINNSILIYETSAKASSQRVNSLSPGPVKLSTRTWYFLLNSRGIWYRGNLLSLPLNLFLKHIYNLQASIKVWPLRNISFNRSHSIDMRGDEKLPMQKK